MELTQNAVELINALSNAVPFNETVKITSKNKAALKELKDANFVRTVQGSNRITKEGKEFLSASGNINHSFAGALAGYEYTMVHKTHVSEFGVSSYNTYEVTFKRERGEDTGTVTRVLISKEDCTGKDTGLFWKLKA